MLLQKARAYFARTGLTSTPQVLVNGVPLKQVDLNPDDFEETIVRQIMMLTPAIQRDVYHVRTSKLTTCCVDVVASRRAWHYVATTTFIYSKCACTYTVRLHYMYVQIYVC